MPGINPVKQKEQKSQHAIVSELTKTTDVAGIYCFSVSLNPSHKIFFLKIAIILSSTPICEKGRYHFAIHSYNP